MDSLGAIFQRKPIFVKVTDDELKRAEYLINTRPRKDMAGLLTRLRYYLMKLVLQYILECTQKGLTRTNI